MSKSKLAQTNETVARNVTKAYKAVETTVIDGYTKIEDAFVERYLTHEGETVSEAKARLKSQQQ